MQEADELLSRQRGASVDEGTSLGEHLAALLEYRNLILAFSLAAALLGAVYALITKPTYESNILVQVEENGNSIGSALGDLASMFELKTAATTEIEILRSRMILGPTVDTVHLDIDAKPMYFPLVGRFLASRLPVPLDGSPRLNLRSFAWGGEAIEVTKMEVPSQYNGAIWTLTVLENGKFNLRSPDDEVAIDNCDVGRECRATARGGAVVLVVSRLIGRLGTRFQLVHSKRLDVITRLQKSLNISEQGKDSGIISTVWRSDDPHKTQAVLNEIARRYVKQNVDRKSAEADNMIRFLDRQLPGLKDNLTKAETKYNTYRTKNTIVDLPVEGQTLLNQIVQAEVQKSQLVLQRDQLLQRFTPRHPNVDAVNRQLDTVNAQIAGFNQRLKAIPASEQDAIGLARDAMVAQEIYTTLLNNVEQLRVLKAGKTGNVRLLDEAELITVPVWPRPGLIVLVATTLGVFLGLLTAFSLKALRSGIEDPAEVEDKFGLPVYATIPHSDQQSTFGRIERSGANDTPLLAMASPHDLAVEAIRSLRTALQFAQFDASNNIVMLTGPAPGVGKSFIAINLAALMANTGKRVLLIDCDLRRGYLHRYVGAVRGRGLTELIRSGGDAEEFIQRDVIVNGLDFMSTGELPPNAAELLLHPNFEQVLKHLASRYDNVIVDTPPVLAVTDPAIVGRYAGVTLLVLRFGANPPREVEMAIKQLRQGGGTLKGVIFNDLPLNTAGYAYGKYKYAYQYEYAPRQ
ncbi:polysaccharide biosynthesis tyrosine autokinase [Burkholderia vietnamiensis]|uniref:polysaccharide biosynthesis tyrosine autokinase n=1 Tax=Burkholderia vietnamiensis TaxID=60552 RepID=UPI001594B26C|nr:polysaccharide biosynthesis tyrosine autokinase [Burkholderia vietnamiensis]